jgi:ABC-type multidrug transport system ATPase subunit
MWRTTTAVVIASLLTLPSALAEISLTSQKSFVRTENLFSSNPYLSIYGDRPPDCPPCFNCNLDDFTCLQFANCTKSSGKCSCPPGFGGEDCSQPLCGSLPEGKDRLPREGKECECAEGWEGINCNVCKTDNSCNAMMPNGEDGVCYREGLVVKENYQMCDITNRKIMDQLKDKKAQATFSCNAEREECNFQFWVDQRESFYCGLENCEWSAEATDTKNTTSYKCKDIKCACIPDRFLCGEDGSVDIGDFLDQEIKGPASFSSVSTDSGSHSAFSEPAMNGLIQNIFGDESITLKCGSGECLYKTEVPGYERPVKKINTPLIAGVIAGCALFVVAVILVIFFLARRNSRRYGPIQLGEDEEDDAAKLLADHKPAALAFENVSYHLKGKQILSGISGAVHPGELMAIMGASGAGKTTFLDLLARKNKRGTGLGDFWVNGEQISDDDFRSAIGFVDQDDTMLPTLTVHETIMDSALLRLPKDMSWAVKAQKVEDVEKQLGIYHIRHQLIGSEEGSGRGISGGEKRRVGIACELVTSPSILFLDEPTSGLDAYNAFNVIECLVTLVKSYNRTVVFTIHQPRSNIVALFDQLVLLAQGRTVYSGPFSKCQNYFDNIGYACPPGFNIADYLVDLTMHATRPDNPVPEDSHPYSDDLDGRATVASSTIAVKSIPSIISNPSIEDGTRPKSKRKTSIRQQQERQLFSRKNTDHTAAPASLRSDGDSILDKDSDKNKWVKMARQNAQAYSINEDSHDLPPDVGSNTNLDVLVSSYEASDVKSELHADIQTAISTASDSNGNPLHAANGTSTGKVRGYRKPMLPTQFLILSRRTWRNLYRNPQLMLTHYAIAILLAVFLGFLFYGLTDDLKGFQNRLGFFFFLLALFGFSTLTSLTTFAPERLLFVRERAKGYYSPLAYYLAKVVFDIVPLRILPPAIMGCIVYPMTGLVPTAPEFGKFMLFLVLFNLAAAMICLFIGIVVRNQGVANLLGVLVMLFSLLFGGFLLNHETIPKGLLWLQSVRASILYLPHIHVHVPSHSLQSCPPFSSQLANARIAPQLSIFHFGFEGLIVNEVRYLSLVDKKYGLNIEVPGSAILSSFGFDVLALWRDVSGLAVVCAAFFVLGYAALHVLLVERR